MTDVEEYCRGVVSKYTEALRIHGHRVVKGIMTPSEFALVNVWYARGLDQIEEVRNNFRKLVIADKMELSDDELEALADTFMKSLIPVREHARDNYILDREMEKRE